MGKGTIQSHLGNGQYSVTLNFDNSGIDDRISRLQSVISELDPKISNRLDEEQQAANDMDSAWQDLQAAITTLEGIDAQENPDAWQAQMDTVTKLRGVYNDTYLVWAKAQAARRELEAAKTDKQQSIDNLESYRLADKTISAWCADLSTDLSGQVGIVEIPGERQHVQIRPGYGGAADYEAARDGAIVPTMAQSPAATFYNLAMEPGWQKWRPGYRTGTISNIDRENDTCDVDLDSESSSIQGLDVNADSHLSGIPIDYMSCNSTPFEDGDHVLVEFAGRDRDNAKVVGFVDNPKACIGDDYKFFYYHRPDYDVDYFSFWECCAEIDDNLPGILADIYVKYTHTTIRGNNTGDQTYTQEWPTGRYHLTHTLFDKALKIAPPGILPGNSSPGIISQQPFVDIYVYGSRLTAEQWCYEYVGSQNCPDSLNYVKVPTEEAGSAGWHFMKRYEIPQRVIDQNTHHEKDFVEYEIVTAMTDAALPPIDSSDPKAHIKITYK